ncbi:hypothetical protein DSO57_1015172, partial [Entomophthora muscae]
MGIVSMGMLHAGSLNADSCLLQGAHHIQKGSGSTTQDGFKQVEDGLILTTSSLGECIASLLPESG